MGWIEVVVATPLVVLAFVAAYRLLIWVFNAVSASAERHLPASGPPVDGSGVNAPTLASMNVPKQVRRLAREVARASSSGEGSKSSSSELPRLPVPPFPRLDKAFVTGINAVADDQRDTALESLLWVANARPECEYARFQAAALATGLEHSDQARELLRPLLSPAPREFTDPLWQRYLKGKSPALVGLFWEPPLTFEADTTGASALFVMTYVLDADTVGALNALTSIPDAVRAQPLLTLMHAGLLAHAEQWPELARLAPPTEPDDDVTAEIWIHKATALRHIGLLDGALEVLKKVLANKGLHQTLRLEARYERALVYDGLGKAGIARKDLEIIWSEDPDFRDVGSKLGLDKTNSPS